eukprot:TRINITY_DN781794_c0_g1_i1.p1 TRINITY_DN781794_c0_g1~~TRINITY_DN781794_c0_g1_i1.p1  ORF type:complete len:254 (+),score=71.07 TRINITY_DN781794_c0_g1_i1:53-814(+)
MECDDFEKNLKIIVVGSSKTGKTAFTTRYCQNYFVQEHKRTVSAEFMERKFFSEDTLESVSMFCWDTASDLSLSKSYYKGASGAIIVFSGTDRDSFNDIKKWYHGVRDECGNIPIALVQNKMDLTQQLVEDYEVEELSRLLNIRLYCASAKLDENVSPVFEYLATKMLNSNNFDNTAALTTLEDVAAEQPSSMEVAPPSPKKQQKNSLRNKRQNGKSGKEDGTSGPTIVEKVNFAGVMPRVRTTKKKHNCVIQ